MESRIAQALKMYKIAKPTVLNTEGAFLPEAYKKFYREWKMTTPSPVHFTPVKEKWVRNEETGEVSRVDNLNVPLPLLFPPESHKGIWGGEGVIKGFTKKKRLKARVPHFWVPNIKKSAVYSEILDKTFSLMVTERTIDLILKHNGFDNYLLESKACDLQSGLALKLKQKILKALKDQDFYNDDLEKKNEVLQKYGHFLENYTEEEIEWYGLTIDEAIAKYKANEEIRNAPKPLKVKLREELISQLKLSQNEIKEKEALETTVGRSWLSKINPFAKKKD